MKSAHYRVRHLTSRCMSSCDIGPTEITECLSSSSQAAAVPGSVLARVPNRNPVIPSPRNFAYSRAWGPLNSAKRGRQSAVTAVAACCVVRACRANHDGSASGHSCVTLSLVPPLSWCHAAGAGQNGLGCSRSFPCSLLRCNDSPCPVASSGRSRSPSANPLFALLGNSKNGCEDAFCTFCTELSLVNRTVLVFYVEPFLPILTSEVMSPWTSARPPQHRHW